MAFSMVIVAKFMMWLAEKGTHVALTERFQDAEFILTYHRAPAKWEQPRSLFARLMQGSGSEPFLQQLRQIIRPEQAAGNPRNLMVQRLDDLIDFFEICPFFQDEASREVMLDQLWEERERWVEGIEHNN